VPFGEIRSFFGHSLGGPNPFHNGTVLFERRILSLVSHRRSTLAAARACSR
jgi:hypothetical protein